MDKIKLTKKEIEAIRHIRNWLVNQNRKPTVRALMEALNYKSPRSAALIIESLIEKSVLARKMNGDLQLLKDNETSITHAHTVDVPLVGTVACGMPIFAEENIEALIPVSTNLARPNHKYFLLRAKGDSMNQAGINEGDLILVKQQTTAENGNIVVAFINDEATVKEFYRSANAIILKPKSTNKNHQPIILADNFQIQGVVVTTIPI